MTKGSIKLTVLYPAGEGKHFDMDYYLNSHIPMAAGLLGDAVIGAAVEKGLGGGAPGATFFFQDHGAICLGQIVVDLADNIFTQQALRLTE